jgi:hypothetical protein
MGDCSYLMGGSSQDPVVAGRNPDSRLADGAMTFEVPERSHFYPENTVAFAFACAANGVLANGLNVSAIAKAPSPTAQEPI